MFNLIRYKCAYFQMEFRYVYLHFRIRRHLYTSSCTITGDFLLELAKVYISLGHDSNT